ncbi:MAG: recombination protein NinG [Campylobacterota bacterium]|nr:recombination protein NinG [Campylobacterota bacterium]
MKIKKCKICKEEFEPIRQLQPTCSKMSCMIEYSEKFLNKKAKAKKQAERRNLRKFNENDVKNLKEKAQTIFNKFIRLRDKNKPCISCNYTGGARQIHASHFRPATNSKLRFNELNVHASCSICNTHLSGNLAEYRLRLIEKIGLSEVEKLESINGAYRYSAEELRDIIKKYKKKVKELENEKL